MLHLDNVVLILKHDRYVYETAFTVYFIRVCTYIRLGPSRWLIYELIAMPLIILLLVADVADVADGLDVRTDGELKIREKSITWWSLEIKSAHLAG
jgi:hypothetical protein